MQLARFVRVLGLSLMVGVGGSMIGCGSEGMQVAPEGKAAAEKTRQETKASHQILHKDAEAQKKSLGTPTPAKREVGGGRLRP